MCGFQSLIYYDFDRDDVMMRASTKFVKVHDLFSVFPCGGSSIQIENRGIQQPDPGDLNQHFTIQTKTSCDSDKYVL